MRSGERRYKAKLPYVFGRVRRVVLAGSAVRVGKQANRLVCDLLEALAAVMNFSSRIVGIESRQDRMIHCVSAYPETIASQNGHLR